LFFASSSPGAETRRAELRQTIRETPLLAHWVARSEVFFLFRRIWHEYRRGSYRSTLPTKGVAAFDAELDFIEKLAKKVPAKLPPDSHLDFPDFAAQQLSGTLDRIASQWRDWAKTEAARPEAVAILKKLPIPPSPSFSI